MISIIVPTFNRAGMLAACLESLTRLQHPKEQFEVIVVDDGGDQDLDAIVESARKAISVHLVKQPNAGPASARNTGAANAQGEFIAFTDDDCKPAENWLTALSSRLQQDPTRMYGGHTVNALKTNVYSTASQSLIDYLYSYYNTDPEQARFFTSNNIAMARNIFEEVGGFDVSFRGACGEDREFADRWLHLGHRMSYVPEAQVFHNHALTFGRFWKQHFGYGTGAWRFRQCRVSRGLKPPKFEPPAFYLGLVNLARKKRLPHPFTLSVLLLLSQLANASGFTWAKFASRP